MEDAPVVETLLATSRPAARVVPARRSKLRLYGFGRIVPFVTKGGYAVLFFPL
jgi:hypothetical protein